MCVDRADTAELLITCRDPLLGLIGHSQTAKHVVEKRRDVIGSFRAAERYDQHGIVIGRLSGKERRI